MTSLKTSIKTITYLSDIGCLEIQGASLGMYSTSNNVREPLWQAMYEQATVTSSIDGETDD